MSSGCSAGGADSLKPPSITYSPEGRRITGRQWNFLCCGCSRLRAHLSTPMPVRRRGDRQSCQWLLGFAPIPGSRRSRCSWSAPGTNERAVARKVGMANNIPWRTRASPPSWPEAPGRRGGQEGPGLRQELDVPMADHLELPREPAVQRPIPISTHASRASGPPSRTWPMK